MKPGDVLGAYRVVSELGAGGMGEVYRARDTKLGRDVAIKVLPGAFTQDAERLARFEREARLLAALDHPHVASIYGFEDLDGVRFLVMQLAEGEDLSQRLSRGPIPVDEAIGIAKQMAGALEAAHGQGIVHRDLKPANIKVAEDGRVKILDFGLAKALESDEADEDFSNSPTMIRAATHAGIILGTAAYMSPEQARGKRVDKRADIWAFGVVLWEMLTGRRLFGGDTVSDTLAAVLTREPDLSDLPAGTPRMLQWVLQRCLERDPTRRLHDIADARIVLDDLPGPGDAEASGPDRDARPVVSTRVHLAWLMALVGACVVTVWLARSGGAPGAGSGDPAHLAIHLAANQQLTTRGNSTLAFSPDGETLVFPGAEDGRVSLFRRRLGDPVATAIPGTADGQAPFFSPDGAWIGFTAGGRLQKVAVDGGRPFELAAIQGSGGATWLGDETIVYAPVYSDGLFRVSADGGTPERLTTPDRAAGELGHWWPDPLPGEAQVLFTAFRTPVDESRIGVVDLDTREITWLVDGGFFGRWVPTGHLVYARGQRVFAMPFDPATLSATGPAVAVLDDVRVAETGGYAMAAVSSRGTLAYATESLGSPLGELVWLDRAGNASPAMEERLRLISASLSPDQRQAAISIKGDSRDLWIYSFDRGTLSRMTTGADTEFDPVWSADSQELFYVVDSPPFELHRIRAGSPDSGRPIWDEPAELDMTGIAVSPDGRTLAFTVAEPDTGDNIYTRPIDGSEPRRPFRATRAAEDWPAFSPDGRWIAYESDESGRPEIYVDPFPGPGDHVQITSDGGTSPIWSKNGELFFRRADDTWSVATRTGDRFEFDTPTRLHTYPIVPNIDEGRAYDVTADGRRLLAVTIPDADRPRQIEVVTGWMAGLVRLAPPRR